MAGILDNAKHGYDDQWLPRSRGADDDAISTAFKKLMERGLADGETVTPEGLEFREGLERKLNNMASAAWRNLGIDQTTQFLELIEPVGSRYMDHIDNTAGSNWMPAGREAKSK